VAHRVAMRSASAARKLGAGMLPLHDRMSVCRMTNFLCFFAVGLRSAPLTCLPGVRRIVRRALTTSPAETQGTRIKQRDVTVGSSLRLARATASLSPRAPTTSARSPARRQDWRQEDRRHDSCKSSSRTPARRTRERPRPIPSAGGHSAAHVDGRKFPER